MWQRVQTLYLAVSLVLTSMMFFCNKAGEIRFTAYVPYLILLIVTTLLGIIALTTYRFRVLQFRTAILNSLILIAFQVWLAVDFFVTGNNPMFHLSAVLPVICVILNILAARNIWADELMVRSASRLRAAKRKRMATN